LFDTLKTEREAFASTTWMTKGRETPKGRGGPVKRGKETANTRGFRIFWEAMFK